MINITNKVKKFKVKLDLLTHIDILLIGEKSVRGGICHATHRYAKTDNKYIKDYDKNKELLNPKYWDVNNLHVLKMSLELPVIGLLELPVSG